MVLSSMIGSDPLPIKVVVTKRGVRRGGVCVHWLGGGMGVCMCGMGEGGFLCVCVCGSRGRW